MRLSRNPHDAGFAQWQALIAEGCRIRVFLDDVEVDYVETADDEEGLIVFEDVPDQPLPAKDRLAFGEVRISVEEC